MCVCVVCHGGVRVVCVCVREGCDARERDV